VRQWLRQRVRAWALGRCEIYQRSRWYLNFRTFSPQNFHGAIGYAREKAPGAPRFILSNLPEDFLRQFQLPFVRHARELPTDERVAVILGLTSDQDAVENIQLMMKLGNVAYFPLHCASPIVHYFHQNNIARQALDACYTDMIEKYDVPDCENIIQALEETRDLPGAYVEIGVYKGSSARAALTYIAAAGLKREAFLLDTYAGFDYEEAKSSADLSWKDTHGDAGIESVTRTLSSCRAPHRLIKSNIIADELPSEIGPICVCNVDVDMYEATMAAFMKAGPRIVRGGVMICEDLGHSPLTIGALVAYKEFLQTDLGKKFRSMYLKSGQGVMIKFAD
jgi:hypothetical protein